MAYGRKYYCEFRNVQGDIHVIYISEKDYEGSATALQGETDTPFITRYLGGDDSVFSPIRGKECSLSFTAENGISLLNFYSEDDEQFRIDHYVHSVAGTVIDKLIASYFIVQDNCEQDFTSEPFTVTLGGTDNIALLKDVSFTTSGMPYHPDDGEYLGAISLFDYVHIAIKQIGFEDLPLRIYANIFENSTNDRTDSATAEMFQETFLDTGTYLSDDGAWKDIYSILEGICKDLNCCFCQDNGAWNIFRRQESYLFTDNKIAGVEHNLTTGDKTAIELEYNWPVVFGSGIILDKANHRSRIQRPFKYAKETFNFKQSAYIKQATLQLPSGATPYETETVDGKRYDRYSLADYFPDWIQRDGDTSYLEIVTDVVSDLEDERYIVTPSPNDTARGVQFNAIPISAGDTIDFSVRYKTFGDTNERLNFGVRFLIIGTGSTSYNLIDFPPIISATNPGLIWDEIDSDDWDRWNGVHAEISDADADNIDTSQYQQYSLSGFLGENRQLPLIPIDGMLLIEVVGTNTYGASDNQTTGWKDIQLTIKNLVNFSTQITSQYHINEQVLADGQKIKNSYDEEINIDDSPRNTIAGTLFTDALTNFNHTDILTGEETQIGDIHFTKTKLWHRTNIIETRRLGEIIVYERMHQAFKPRTIIDGTLYGLRHQLADGSWNFVSLLCLLTLDSLPNLNFIFGVLEVDWMNATYKAVLNELYMNDDNSEPFSYNYIFNYIYKTN